MHLSVLIVAPLSNKNHPAPLSNQSHAAWALQLPGLAGPSFPKQAAFDLLGIGNSTGNQLAFCDHFPTCPVVQMFHFE